MKSRVPIADYHEHMRGYAAESLPEYSDAEKHVYYSRSMQKYIVARRRGNSIELEFTDDCPCGG